MGELILTLKVFIFVLSCLNIIKNIYGFVKVMRLQQGHFDNGKYGNLCFGLSLSYIITLLITGF
jgi:hypothetical protein